MRRAFLGSPAAAGVMLSVLHAAAAVEAMAAAEGSPSSSGCDESKCRNPGPYGGYTCLTTASGPEHANHSTEGGGGHRHRPLHLCADGYEGRPIDDVGPVTGDDGITTYGYYTCCPPGYNGTVGLDCRYDIFEACAHDDHDGGDGWEGFDCWAVGTPQDPMVCSDGPINVTAVNGSSYHEVVPYFPRKTGAAFLWIQQYVCCRTFDGVTTSVDRSSALYHGFNAALNFVVFLVCVVFISGIMSSRKARSQEFNMYLVFLAIPDAIYNGGHFVVNSGLRIDVRVLRQYLLRGWLWWFNLAANMWINAIIAYEIHAMLIKAKRCRRRKASHRSKLRVFTQAFVAYAFAVVPATWELFLRQGKVRGLGWEDWYHYLALVLVAGPPLLYVIYAMVDTKRRRLLPRCGRTRTLAIYFRRVIFVFVFMWIPSIVIYQTGARFNIVWLLYVGVVISTLQGLVSVAVAMNKPDVRAAVIDLIMCRCCRDDEADKAVLPTSGALERDPSSSDDDTSETGSPAHNIDVGEGPAAEGAPSSNDGEEKIVAVKRSHKVKGSKRISVWDEPDDWMTQSEPI